ncbi:ATP-binding cassette domain-containing protein [Candidatus Woesearchaeota archaeon]|nr:ATP-binding cassette domain-containing protein [Nanoarchaeota archaeon]MCB9370910.1 ATP-binding cassette domain-containing protein [Candidatus Woesearchaeota archaeon]USN44011.1 MAG: ATP-binding cassette domain-containing protein [Candidatus Woesearchaeota archaeon]
MVISVKNLNKKFKTKKKEAGLKGSLKAVFKPKYQFCDAVKNLNLEIQKGESVAFIGPNGAGKSTTLKMLTGILFPSSGQMEVLGYEPSKERKKLAYKIGTVFGQKSQLWFHLPPMDSFELFSKIYDLEEKEYKKRLDYLIKVFEIKEFLYTPVRKLSLGQRMRAELVLALLHKPEIILLDEPTIGLDIMSKKALRKVIKTLNKEEGITLILTSHDMDDIESVCERVVIINHGQVVYDDSMSNLKKHYLNKKVFEIIFENPIEKEFHKNGVSILEKEEFRIKCEVDLRKTGIKECMEEVMKEYEDKGIADINISDREIEEIIEEIYKQK